jgi:hypothetical protein
MKIMKWLEFISESYSPEIEKQDFLVYEFESDGISFFVRFYERDKGIWRRGYWFKENDYFSKNIEKIKYRLKSGLESERTKSRLQNELDYFNKNTGRYDTGNLLGKTKNPFTIVEILTEITIDFLNRKSEDCDILEIHHMRNEEDGDVSVRLKLNKRSILRRLDSKKWSYLNYKSTSIIHKKDIDPQDFSIEIY